MSPEGRQLGSASAGYITSEARDQNDQPESDERSDQGGEEPRALASTDPQDDHHNHKKDEDP